MGFDRVAMSGSVGKNWRACHRKRGAGLGFFGLFLVSVCVVSLLFGEMWDWRDAVLRVRR